MNEKCLKTPLYINETVISDTAEQAIDTDFTLPDYCPDISRLFKCKSTAYISAKGINGNTLNIEGTVCITLLYADKDGRLSSYEYLYPFVKSIEVPSDTAGANICCKAKCEYINCRAVTGRKVDIHGAVSLHYRVFKRKATEIVSDYDDSDIELLRDTAPATVPMGYSEKYIMLEEEISIGQGQPTVKSILRYDTACCVRETKVINGKAVVKGEMSVCLLYSPEGGGNLQSVKSVIPFSQIVEVEGMTDSCRCDTRSEIAFSEIKPRSDLSGECKGFSLTAKLLLTCEAFCINEVGVVLDAFSRRFKSDISKSSLSFEKINCTVSEQYQCKKSVELEESISSVVDLWCNLQACAVKFDGANMLICGTVISSMIICNEQGNAVYCEKPIDFEYKYSPINAAGQLFCEPQIEILNCGYTITASNKLELYAELGINAAIYERNKLSLVTDIGINDEMPINNCCRAAMKIYFAGENESVWDIARLYNAGVDEIMQINGLETQRLANGQMLLVPVL